MNRAVDRRGRPRARARLEAQAKPPARPALLRAGQCGDRSGRRLRGARRGGSCGGASASAGRSEIGLVVIGPEAPLVAGLADDLEAARHQGVRAVAGGGAARRLQRLHQGSLRRIRHPHGRLSPLRRRVRGQGLCGDAEPAHRGQGRRARRRQGRGHRRDARGRPMPPSTTASAARSAPPGPRSSSRSSCDGEEASFFALVDGDDRAAARHGAGPQARLRRRPGPQHRRHGRLLAGADHDACSSARK